MNQGFDEFIQFIIFSEKLRSSVPETELLAVLHDCTTLLLGWRKWNDFC